MRPIGIFAAVFGFVAAIATLGCAGIMVHGLSRPAPEHAAPIIVPMPATPEPDHRPDDARRPRRPHRDFAEAATPIGEKATVGGPVGPGGRQVMCDLPFSSGLRMKNVGGTDGSGLCVFTSLTHAMRYALERTGWEFRQKMQGEKGGGWPEKVDAMMSRYCPGVRYLQYEGTDPAALDACLQSGRMCSVTYGYGERYGHGIAHMVNLVYFDSEFACVLDNNFVGEEQLEWMTRAEFLRRWKLGDPRGYGWCVVILRSGPPVLPYQPSLN